MRLLRILCGAAIGAIAATILSWGGLYLFGMVSGPGSLFDTNPEAANLFFALWLTLTIPGAIVGGVRASRC